MLRAYSLETTLMSGKIEIKRRRKWQRMRWLDSTMDSMGMNLSKLQKIAKDRGAWWAAFHGVPKSQTWLSYWTTTTNIGRLWGSQKIRTVGPPGSFSSVLCEFPPASRQQLPYHWSQGPHLSTPVFLSSLVSHPNLFAAPSPQPLIHAKT